MDLSQTLAEINALPIEDRLRLVHEIWDGIAAEKPVIEPSGAQRQELDRRIAALEANPDDLISRDELRRRLQKRRS